MGLVPVPERVTPTAKHLPDSHLGGKAPWFRPHPKRASSFVEYFAEGKANTWMAPLAARRTSSADNTYKEFFRTWTGAAGVRWETPGSQVCALTSCGCTIPFQQGEQGE